MARRAARLGEHVPSVTSYVHRLEVAGRPLYAKYSILGASLVSVVRGIYGDWDKVLNSQYRYVQRGDAILARESAQLRLLSRQHRVCTVAGYARGVLFVETISSGVTLSDVLFTEPHHASL